MKEQVIKFEKILDESRAIIDELQVILDKLEKNQNNYQELKVYYGSEEYFKDVEFSQMLELLRYYLTLQYLEYLIFY